MKIFFIASIYGKARYEEEYRAIIDTIKDLGHKIEADHVMNVNKQLLSNWDDNKDLEFHKKVLEGVKKADVVIGDLSYSSTSVGYLLAVAVEAGKPTIALYSGSEEPHLLTALTQNEKFQLLQYTDSTSLKSDIKYAIEYASEQQDTRFNFFISTKHQNYLDWISKSRKIPRAVYLRRLIEKDMEENQDYRV